jgi:hypothetical protein
MHSRVLPSPPHPLFAPDIIPACIEGRRGRSIWRRWRRCTPSGFSALPAYVSIRQHASACVSIRQHTSAYVSIRQHTSAYVSIRQHKSAYTKRLQRAVSIRQHTSAYVSIRQHTSAYVSIRLEALAEEYTKRLQRAELFFLSMFFSSGISARGHIYTAAH